MSSLTESPPRAASDLRTRVFSCALFLLPTLALTLRSGISLVEIAILCASLWYAPVLWRRRAELFEGAGGILLSVAATFALAVVSLAATGFDGRFLENPAKALLILPVTGLVALGRPRATWFWMGLAAGTLGAAAIACYQRFVLLVPRAEGAHMAIMFGDVAMAMGLMALAGMQVFARTRLSWLPFATFVAGLAASLLSGTRGGWLAMVLAFVPLYTYGAKTVGRRIIAVAMVGLMLLAGAALVPQLGVQQRLIDVVHDIDKYEAGDPFTSVGLRFENWKGAVRMFAAHPLTGVGRANYEQGLNALVARGDLHPSVVGLRHAHNEILNALATEGVIGGLALLFVYAAPFLFFLRQLRTNDAARAYALAGLLLVLSFIDFGLTQVLFAHHIGSAFYTITVGTLAGLCIAARHHAA